MRKCLFSVCFFLVFSKNNAKELYFLTFFYHLLFDLLFSFLLFVLYFVLFFLIFLLCLPFFAFLFFFFCIALHRNFNANVCPHTYELLLLFLTVFFSYSPCFVFLHTHIIIQHGCICTCVMLWFVISCCDVIVPFRFVFFFLTFALCCLMFTLSKLIHYN